MYSNHDNAWHKIYNGVWEDETVTALCASGSNIIAGTDNDMILSSNYGKNITDINDGLPPLYFQVSSLAMIGNTVFAGIINNSNYEEIYKFSDTTNTWTAVNNGFISNINESFLDQKVPLLAASGSILYAGTLDSGVYKSTNNGLNWTPINNGLPTNIFYGDPSYKQIWSLAVKGDTILAGTQGGVNGGVYFSPNKGISWTQRNNGLPTYPCILSLAIKGNYLFAGLQTNALPGVDGVYFSPNFGLNWFDANKNLPRFTDWTEGIGFQTMSLTVFNNNIVAGIRGLGVRESSISDLVMTYCSAQFSLTADTTTPHHYYVTNNAYGVPPLTYLWSWGDGSYDNTAYPSHTYGMAGYYNICLTITDSMGCTSSFCDSSYLQKAPFSMITVNVIPQETVGISENNFSEKINIYPNPTTDNLTVEAPAQSTIQIFTIQGQLIKTITTIGAKTNIDHVGLSSYVVDVSALPAGVYVVEVRTEKGIAVKKFIKE